MGKKKASRAQGQQKGTPDALAVVEVRCGPAQGAPAAASPRHRDGNQGPDGGACESEAATLRKQLEELSRAREEDKAAWLAEKQQLQGEAAALREQLQERTKLFKDALCSLDAKGIELQTLRQQLQDMQEAAGSSQPIMADGSVKKCLRSNGEMVHDHEQEDRKKRDMFVEEMEQAHADELTAQAEEIVNLQDEIKETGAALEAKDSEVVQLRFQLIMLEKIYREKKEEHANLVASMKAVEGIWEREHSHAEQRERVLLTEIQWLRDKLGERDRQWEVSFQQLMQEAVRREDLLRTLNQGTDQSGESVMSWLWSPSVTSSQSPVVSYQSGTRTKSIFFDDEFLHEVLHDVLHDEFRMSSMTKALRSPQEGKSDGGSGGPLTWNLPPLPAPPRPLGESDLAAIRQHLPVPFQQLGDSAGAGERERARETAGDQKGDAPTDLHRTRSPHASYLSNRGGTSTTDSTLSRVLDPFDGNSAGIRVHGESLAQKSGPADVLKEDIHAWRPPPTRPLTPSPAPATPLSLPFDPDLSLNSPTSVWSTESDMKWSY